ncbi:hypothetical protein ACFWFI_10615 [Streptomyces sp. NPDC060209]|uniref:hypothetical protein n=1 Tax=Streptomyces sp. NPDC060209 TaxID=3347073 RepID=UPI003660B251
MVLGIFVGLALLAMLAVGITWAVIGIHALLLGRMPGRRLPRYVRQPRLWGAGALLMLASWYARSPSLLVIGIGLIALGHVAKPTR